MGGFGNQGFGNERFGNSSYGQEIIVENVPVEYYVNEDNKENEPLYHYVATIANSFTDRKDEIDNMSTFMSPLDCPSGLLPYLADAIAVGIDDYEPEEFQRSITNNAVQYFTLKGTRDAYRIRGLMSGFDVEVVALWHVSPYYAPEVPAESLIEIPPGSGNFFSKLGPTEVSGVSGIIPSQGECEYCLTSFVSIDFTLVKAPDQGFPKNILDRIVEKIREIMPIHVRELVIELRVNIEVDMSYDSVEQSVTEESFANVGFNYRFDLWPGDVVPTDAGAVIQGTTYET